MFISVGILWGSLSSQFDLVNLPNGMKIFRWLFKFSWKNCATNYMTHLILVKTFFKNHHIILSQNLPIHYIGQPLLLSEVIQQRCGIPGRLLLVYCTKKSSILNEQWKSSSTPKKKHHSLSVWKIQTTGFCYTFYSLTWPESRNELLPGGHNRKDS